jgi:hypothetical protein
MKRAKPSLCFPSSESQRPFPRLLQLFGAATLLVGCDGAVSDSQDPASSGSEGPSMLAPNGGTPVLGAGSGEPTVIGVDGMPVPPVLGPTAVGDPSASPGASPAGAPAGSEAPPTTPGVVPPPAVEDLPPPPFEPAVGMMRRLTRTQFRNAVRDVFDVEVDVNELDLDNWDGDFATIGAASVVTLERGVEQYQTAIETALVAVLEDPTRRDEFIGCAPSEAACVRGFIERVGRRAWRRPLETTEVDRLVGVADYATTELGDVVEGVRWATVALFTSPHFLYRTELGTPAASGELRFVGYEAASRLAFLVWNSLPDDALLDEAASGALDTADGVRNAAARLLDTPAGREAIGAFADEYMRLDKIVTQAKDQNLFPEYGGALQEAMVRDMRATWESIAFDDQTSALELFTTNKVVVNADLARLYGLDASGLDSTTFAEQLLPEDGPRQGILSKAAFLSQFANQKEGSPTLRGKFMRQALLCTSVPDPPANVDIVLDEPPPDMPRTKRERLELHRTNDSCALCHALMDPLGLPLETFDAIGRYRTEELGLPIDPSGEVNGEPVVDASDLGVVLGASEDVARCLVEKYYAYALGFEPRDVDEIVLNELNASFEASGYQLRKLILDTIAHEAFFAVAPQAESSEVSQ